MAMQHRDDDDSSEAFESMTIAIDDIMAKIEQVCDMAIQTAVHCYDRCEDCCRYAQTACLYDDIARMSAERKWRRESSEKKCLACVNREENVVVDQRAEKEIEDKSTETGQFRGSKSKKLSLSQKLDLELAVSNLVKQIKDVIKDMKSTLHKLDSSVVNYSSEDSMLSDQFSVEIYYMQKTELLQYQMLLQQYSTDLKTINIEYHSQSSSDILSKVELILSAWVVINKSNIDYRIAKCMITDIC